MCVRERMSKVQILGVLSVLCLGPLCCMGALRTRSKGADFLKGVTAVISTGGKHGLYGCLATLLL